MENIRKLAALLRGRHPLVWAPTFEESYALLVAKEAAMELGMPVSAWSAVRGVWEALLEGVEGAPGTMNASAALTHWSLRTEPAVLVALDLAAHLTDPLALRALRELVDRLGERGGHLVMIDHAESLPPVVAAHAVRFDLDLPDEQELEAIVVRELKGADRRGKISLATGKDGIKAFARAMRGLSRSQAERITREAVETDRRFDDKDLERAIAGKRRMLSMGGALEPIEAPVSMDDVGGLSRLKEWLTRRGGAVDSSRAEELGLPPARGVLILGVQGAGKSLCAKAIATAWKRPLLRLDPGALYDRYVGESERRLRDALEQARAMAPCVLWIDEIEKGFASAASRSTDGGLSQRMFGTLLTWLQERKEDVFVAATANDIEALPPELLRKGRFDEIFFVDLPGAKARKEIAKSHLKKRRCDPKQFDLAAIAAASEGYSGAEIEQAILGAAYESLADEAVLTSERVVSAMKRSPPLSVTMAERIEWLREWAKGRCVMAEDS